MIKEFPTSSQKKVPTIHDIEKGEFWRVLTGKTETTEFRSEHLLKALCKLN